MWFWIIAGLVVIVVAVMYSRSQRKLNANGTSLGGMESRATERRYRGPMPRNH